MSEAVDPPEPLDREDDGLDSAVGARVVEDTPPEPADPQGPEDPMPLGETHRLEHAGFWRRLGAYLVDYVILALPTALALGLLGLDPPTTSTAVDAVLGAGPPSVDTLLELARISAAVYVLQWPYFAGFEASTWQATPGKRVLGLEVTDLQGRRITLLRATGRYFSKILSELILAIGYLMIGFTAKKQGLHDKLTDCLVLKR